MIRGKVKADPDIPELIEARERLGEMREVEVTVR
jgi:hypothetical protein